MRAWKSTLPLNYLKPGDQIDFSFFDWIIFATYYRGDARLMPPGTDSEWETFKGPSSDRKKPWIPLFRSRAIEIAENLAKKFGCTAKVEKEADREGMSFLLQ